MRQSKLNTFQSYARYYDLLYRDKPYEAEAAYVLRRLATQGGVVNSILELGCGTGGHARWLAERVGEVQGIDISGQMLDEAERRRKLLPENLAKRISLSLGDARTVRLGRAFDAVVSLFHVASYQTSNHDIAAMIRTAREHLGLGGVFLFDCWYGPGVLSDRPTSRVLVLEDSRTRVERVATPEMYPDENLVSVHYQIQIEDRVDNSATTFEEIHPMRYFFVPELRAYLAATGFIEVSAFSWMGDCSPGFDDWTACFVATAG